MQSKSRNTAVRGRIAHHSNRLSAEALALRLAALEVGADDEAADLWRAGVELAAVAKRVG